MSERKMCKFYNLNLPQRDTGERDPGSPLPPDEQHNNHSPEDLDLDIPPDQHKLQHGYWLWFSRRPPAGSRPHSTQGYNQALQLVGRIATVEQWWGLYAHLARPADLPPLTDLSLFKLGIKPMWEDEANIGGGKWVVRLRKGLAGQAWEDLCMAMLGEQFTVGDELCGVVLSIRFQEDHLAIWHRTAADTTTATRIRDTLRRVLQLQPTTPIEYKEHGDCIRASAAARQENNVSGGSSSTPSSNNSIASDAPVNS